MRKKMFFLFIILTISIPLFSGCWNYREINNLSIIAGVAIDKSADGKYWITVEIVEMSESGREEKIKSKKLENYGVTLFDAIRNMIKINGTKLYWGHTEIVILSQEVAKEGIVEIVDFLARDAEPRLTIDLLISKEKTAKEILDAPSITAVISSFNINKMLDSQNTLSKIPKIQTYEFISALSGEGISAVLPCIQLTTNNGEKTPELSGAAIFKQDKLAGFLDEDETKAFLFIRNRLKGGIITLKVSSQFEHEDISLEILENKTKLEPMYTNGELSMNIEVKTKVTLGENGAKVNLNDNKYKILEKEAEDNLKINIQNVIKKVQEDYNIDIFGFGKTIKEDIPSLWKKIGPQWDQRYKKMDVIVETNVELKDSGLLSKPIKVGD